MKVRIGYTNRYLDVESLDWKHLNILLEDLKEGNIACSYCKAKIKPDDYNVVMHNPKEKDIPIRIHFFCFEKKCIVKWGEIAEKDRTKILNGDFQNE